MILLDGGPDFRGGVGLGAQVRGESVSVGEWQSQGIWRGREERGPWVDGTGMRG